MHICFFISLYRVTVCPKATLGQRQGGKATKSEAKIIELTSKSKQTQMYVKGHALSPRNLESSTVPHPRLTLFFKLHFITFK